MRRPQDRGATRRGAPPHLPKRASSLAILVGAIAACCGLLAAPAAAQKGCAGKPGDPQQAAVFQYCPHPGKPHHGPGSGDPPGSTGFGQAGAPAGQSGNGKTKAQLASIRQTMGDSGKAELPISNYPSTGGVNVLLVLLAAVALGIAVAYGARRWRRSRPQAP